MAEDDESRTRRRIAVLIDGDNAKPGLLEDMMEEVGKYGAPTVRRVYGDWTDTRLQGWKKVLHEHAFQPVQQFRYVTGKNSTDAALIIDAMDVLYSGVVESFCLISSDSDYTRLATRLREAGKFVIGMGEKKTPKPLVRACDLFVYTENLARPAPPPQPRASARPSRPGAPDEVDLESLLTRAFDLVEEEDGWTNLGRLGTALHQIDPGFDPRSYRHKKLLDLIEARPELFEIDVPKKKGPSQVFIRRRDER